MLGSLYHHATLLALILIVMYSAHIFTNAILKNMKKMKKMKNNMKVYISGKIGEEVISEATRQKFSRAENMLRGKGYDVFNPTTSGLERHAESLTQAADYQTSFYQEILLLDLVQLAQCDGIYILGDWVQSKGANVEVDFALATGKQILWEKEKDAKVFCDEEGNYRGVWLPIE